MIEAAMLWNEPNNLSHWDFEIDPEWQVFGSMVKSASNAISAENPRVPCVLGGISPIDPRFVELNHWQIHEWPEKLDEIREVTDLPLWVSEVGVSTFGAEEVQQFGLKRTAELLIARAPRIHWYSLYDLPRAWPATTRHREAEGSSYYRHFYMGLLCEDGSPKLAASEFSRYTPDLGICQWFHFEDPRLDDAVCVMRDMGVKYLRTGLSWADSHRPGAEAWFDCQVRALEPFDVTVTLCFTPESCGVRPNHTSPPQNVEEYAEFCGRIIRRYGN